MKDLSSKERKYYFFDYLFWLGEMTWKKYHKVNFKQPRGSDMLWACIILFIFIPVLTIAGHFLHDLAFEVFGALLVIVFSISVFMTDRLFGKIYPPSRRKAVMKHYEGRKFSRTRRNILFFSLILSVMPAIVLLSTALTWMTGNKVKPVKKVQVEVLQKWKDYISIHAIAGARREIPGEALQCMINQDHRTLRYGQPVYVMQVRDKDLAGKFRARLLNHTTMEDVQDGFRKFVECTWIKGYTTDSTRILLTGWYEVNHAAFCPVDSLEWTEDTEF